MSERVISREPGARRPLGQVRPAATTYVTLYTCPAGLAGIITLIVVCNTDTATFYRIHNSATGAASAVGNALVYDCPIAAANVAAGGGTDTEFDHCPTQRVFFGNGDYNGLALRSPGTVQVYSTSGNITFTAYGYEIEVG